MKKGLKPLFLPLSTLRRDLVALGWAILVHAAAAHCSVWLQGTRQMPSVAWLPCACQSLPWPGAAGQRAKHPALPCLPPTSPGAVHGERQQHPARHPGCEGEGERRRGHSPNRRPGDSWVATWESSSCPLCTQDTVTLRKAAST